MKLSVNSFVVVLCLVIGAFAQAATTSSSAIPATQPQANENQISTAIEGAIVPATSSTALDGWQATGHFSMANQLESRAASNGITSDVKFGSSPAAGLGIRYGHIQTRNLGFIVGLSYEFNRQIDSVMVSNKSGSAGGGIKDKTVRLSMFIPEANVAYGFTDRFYGLGGINYPFPQTTEFDDISMRGELGTQVGIGTLANQNLHVELLYRTINLPWYATDVYSIESKLWGVMLRAGYTL